MVSTYNARWEKENLGYPTQPNSLPSGHTDVQILGYVSKQARENSITDYIAECVVVKRLVGVYTDLPSIYEALKTSDIQSRMLHPEIREVKDSEGNIIVPFQPIEYENYESNWFADAVDDV